MLPLCFLAVGQPLPVKPRHTLNPARAFLLGLVVPGSGQVYNKQVWKLPVLLATFFLLGYNLNYQHQLYSYTAAALSYEQDMNPLTQNPWHTNQSNLERRLQFFRRQRDLAILLLPAAYILQAAEAYVAAHLSTFDVSNDLTFKTVPFYKQVPDKGMVFGIALRIQFVYVHKKKRHET